MNGPLISWHRENRYKNDYEFRGVRREIGGGDYDIDLSSITRWFSQTLNLTEPLFVTNSPANNLIRHSLLPQAAATLFCVANRLVD